MVVPMAAYTVEAGSTRANMAAVDKPTVQRYNSLGWLDHYGERNGASTPKRQG